MGYGMDDEEWFDETEFYSVYRPNVKRPCPVCGKRVKEIGMSDHIRDVHRTPPCAAQAEPPND